MKNFLILFAAAIGFAACSEEESINMNEVLNEYSMEQLNALVEQFDPSQINQSELIRDLTTGSIDCSSSMYYWYGVWQIINWEGSSKESPFNGGHKVAVFNEDGTGIWYYLDCYNSSYEPIGTTYRNFEWKYDAKSGQIQYKLDAKNSYWKCWEVKYYNSPLIIMDQFSLDENYYPKDDPTRRMRYKCNLKAITKDEQLEKYQGVQHIEDVDLLHNGYGQAI